VRLEIVSKASRENPRTIPMIATSNRMSKWYAGAVAVTVAAVAVAASQAAPQGTKHSPLFTARQVAQGERLYAAKCATCHGEDLQGGAAGPLTGPGFAARWTSGAGVIRS